MENVLHETVISLAQAAKGLPNKPAIPTVWRWCTKGVGGVYLEHVRIGRTIFTSREAVGRFVTACTDGTAPMATPPRRVRRARSEKQVQRDNLRAAKRLQARGIKVPEHLLEELREKVSEGARQNG